MHENMHELAAPRRRGGVPTAYVMILVAALATATLAQIGSQGTISGFVRDETGAVITGATVVVTQADTKLSRTVRTESNGYYVVPNVPPGTYEVAAENPGFKKVVQTNLILDAAGRLSVDLTLPVGAASQSVTVTAEAVHVDQSSAQLGKVLDGNLVSQLPLNSRNPVYLVATKPGVVGNPSTFNIGTGNGNMAVNGNRGNSNSILLDGVQIVRTRSGDFNAGEITVDTLQEVNVLTGSYSAEFGRATGGQSLFITKSGTSTFHGSAWEFVRNDMFDANTWSNNHTPVKTPRPPYKFNQPGYTIGGPFYIPNRLNTSKKQFFFFWSQEWSIQHQQGSNRSYVPSAALRAGNISEFGPGPDGIWGTHDDPIRNPATCAAGYTDPACVGFTNPDLMRFPGVLSPNGLALLKIFPAANCDKCFTGSNDNFYMLDASVTTNRKDVLRADVVKGVHHAYFRYSGLQYTNNPAWNFGFASTYKWPWNTYSGSLNVTSTLRNSLVNQFTFGASTDIARLGYAGTAVSQASRSAVGLSYPYIFGDSSKMAPDKIPTVNFNNGAGYSGINGGPYPGRSAGVIYTWTDALTWVKQAHTFKFGVNVERSGENDMDQVNIVNVQGGTNNANGTFNFSANQDVRNGGTCNGQVKGCEIVNALLGKFDTYNEIGGKSYTPWRATSFESFAQDNWKVLPRLTLDYGIRFNFWPPMHSLWSNIAMFDPRFYQPGMAFICNPTTGTTCANPWTGASLSSGTMVLNPNVPFSTARYNGMVLPGSGWPSSASGHVVAAGDPSLSVLFHDLPAGFSNNNFAVDPRLGFAWGVDNKTSVRSHVGVFHMRMLNNDSTLLGGNPPLQPSIQVSNGKVDNPGGTGAASSALGVLAATSQSVTLLKAPTLYEWSFSVQRQIPFSTVLEIAYVGNRGVHLQREIDLNSLRPGTNSAVFAKDANGVITGFNSSGSAAVRAARPYLGYGNIRQAVNTGASSYKALQVSAARRFVTGLNLNIAYTLSHAMDNASSYRDGMPNPWDDRDSWGNSGLDVRHVFSATYSYDLPFGRGRYWAKNIPAVLDYIIGGWQISGVSYYRTGTVFWVGNPVDGLGVANGGFQGVNIVGSMKPVSDPCVGCQYFNKPQGFQLPALGSEWNEMRGQFYNPRFQSHDLGLHKNFRVSERVNLQFRAEAFNFINHPNLSNPSNNLSNSSICQKPLGCAGGVPFGVMPSAPDGTTGNNFGYITGKSGDRRNLQLALKLEF